MHLNSNKKIKLFYFTVQSSLKIVPNLKHNKTCHWRQLLPLYLAINASVLACPRAHNCADGKCRRTKNILHTSTLNTLSPSKNCKWSSLDRLCDTDQPNHIVTPTYHFNLWTTGRIKQTLIIQRNVLVKKNFISKEIHVFD